MSSAVGSSRLSLCILDDVGAMRAELELEGGQSDLRPVEPEDRISLERDRRLRQLLSARRWPQCSQPRVSVARSGVSRQCVSGEDEARGRLVLVLEQEAEQRRVPEARIVRDRPLRFCQRSPKMLHKDMKY